VDKALVILALLVTGCNAGLAYSLGNAAVNTGIAAGASAERRAEGECYTPCGEGTRCNPETGYCERESSSDAPEMFGLDGPEQESPDE